MDRKWVKWTAIITVLVFFLSSVGVLGYSLFFGK
ncbi:MAG TPA: transcriptional regulator [Clostridia bacterium]|nr:transcriptional regulator [Clostridia bacterium]